ncbi:hypothetical protein RRG08_005779 [Elysia crispata]|uniref:Uncharacterized protein n=1 Tax=Elysia crispata TaxID=231223 RepID=A0AAE1BD39_9GAST|nr:hypothetical protein RRG08_005779 [Elysia crispata]
MHLMLPLLDKGQQVICRTIGTAQLTSLSHCSNTKPPAVAPCVLTGPPPCLRQRAVEKGDTAGRTSNKLLAQKKAVIQDLSSPVRLLRMQGITIRFSSWIVTLWM